MFSRARRQHHYARGGGVRNATAVSCVRRRASVSVSVLGRGVLGLSSNDERARASGRVWRRDLLASCLRGVSHGKQSRASERTPGLDGWRLLCLVQGMILFACLRML
jgi:hypothetical protein